LITFAFMIISPLVYFVLSQQNGFDCQKPFDMSRETMF